MIHCGVRTPPPRTSDGSLPEGECEGAVHKRIHRVSKTKTCRKSRNIWKDLNRTSRSGKYNWHQKWLLKLQKRTWVNQITALRRLATPHWETKIWLSREEARGRGLSEGPPAPSGRLGKRTPHSSPRRGCGKGCWLGFFWTDERRDFTDSCSTSSSTSTVWSQH